MSEAAGRFFLRMPRINANEDAAKITTIHAAVGKAVKAGELLFDVETTKAASEVAAPADGVVKEVLVAVGDDTPVGARLCLIDATGPLVDADADIEIEGAAGAVDVSGERQVSKRAELRAKELGVDIALVPAHEGKVRVKDVEDFAARNRGQSAPTGGPAVLRSRYRRTDAVMIGGGGHARILLDAVRGSGWNVIGCLDKKQPGTRVLGEIEILGPDDMLGDLYDRGVRVAFVGAAGSAIDPKLRIKIFDMLKEKGFVLPPLVHKTAHLGERSEIGEATYLCGGAQVGAQVLIGDGVIVNTNASVAHDSVIGDHCHLTPNAVIAGFVRIGAGTTVGMCATVMNGVEVGRNCLIHNNASVAQNIPDGTVVTR